TAKVGAVAMLHQSPLPVTPGYSATYQLTITRGDQANSGGNLAVDLALSGLPSGATYLGPSQVVLTSKQATVTVSAQIGTSSTVPMGAYSFTVKATRGGAVSDNATATSTLLVGTAAFAGPHANNDSYSTTAGASVSGNVLPNDVAGISSTLTVTSNTSPTNGILTTQSNGGGVANDGQFTYTPNAGFTGVDTFTYTLRDGNGLSDSALVTISVGQDATTTTVASSPSPSTYGQSVTFTATVTDTSGSAPAGS